MMEKKEKDPELIQEMGSDVNLLDSALKYVRKLRSKQQPPCQYSIEELKEGRLSAKEGAYKTQEEMRKEHQLFLSTNYSCPTQKAGCQMKRMNSFICLTLLCICLFSCSKDSDESKIVKMTIYSETGYSKPILSPVWTDALVYSESDDSQKMMLTSTITEGFDFEYERGYEYTFMVEKVWMSNPPMDVSSIKYVYVGTLTKEKVITENREEEIELFVSSETVEYVPIFPIEYDENGNYKIYDALFVQEINGSNYCTAVLKEIEGFDFERGYEYTLRVKKITQADPYLLRYILLDVKDKQKK